MSRTVQPLRLTALGPVFLICTYSPLRLLFAPESGEPGESYQILEIFTVGAAA